MDRYHPGYFGKKGIRTFALQKNRLHFPCINLDKVWTLVTEQARKAYVNNQDRVPVIDVTKAGVLGKGF